MSPLAAPIAWTTLSQSRFGYTHTWEVEIDYDGVNTQLMSTNYFTIGANLYQPYVLSVAPLDFGITDESNVASLASCEIKLRRGVIAGSAETMDDRYTTATILGKAVRVYSQFTENTGARLAVARLIVEATEIEDLGVIRLTCVNDERKLIALPSQKLGDIVWNGAPAYDVPSGYDANRPMPLVIGTVRPLGSLALKKWALNRSPGGVTVQAVRSIPSPFPTNPSKAGGAQFAIARYNGTTGVPHYALEYVDGWDAYARIVAAPGLGIDPSSCTTDYDPDVDAVLLTLWGPHITQNSIQRAAEVRAMAVEFDAAYANPANNHNNTAVNGVYVNDTPITLTVGGTTRLSLRRASQGGQPPDYKTSTIAPTAVICRLYYNVTGVTGTPTLAVYAGAVDGDTVGTDSARTNGTALVSSTPGLGAVRWTMPGIAWDTTNLFVKFLVSGSATSVTLTDVYLEFEYRSSIRAFERFKVWQSGHLGKIGGIPLSLGGRPWTVYDYATTETSTQPEGNKLLVTYDGDNVAARSGGFDYRRPVGCAYYILYWLLGTATGDIATDTFTAVDTYHSTSRFKTWLVGRQLLDLTPSIDILRELCSQAGMLLWRSGDGQWKAATLNHSTGVVATFGDRSETFPAWDFKWRYRSEFNNAFKFNYRWDPVRQRFGSNLRVDKDATVDSFLTATKAQCTAAYTAYGSVETAPDVDLYWVQDTDVAMNCAKIIVNYATLRRRVVTFKTKISGMLIEPGDAIQTDHIHQTWSAASVTFQVRTVRILPESGEMEITAYEINELA